MEVNYGEKKIEFQIQYKKRKSMKISVKPTLEVEVSAPEGIEDEKIKEIVLKKAAWILERRDYFEKHSPSLTHKYYVSGEIHRYLGNQYTLKVIADTKNDVKLKDRFIYIHTIHKHDSEYNKNLLYKWYRENSKKKFSELFDACYENIKKYDVEKPTWSIRKMKIRWGSYHPKNNHILLNIELAKAPIYEIEYVIMHELCHVKHPNHSKRFYNFMDLVMPDWEERKKKLEEVNYI
ncbi:M48 family metallopeptidase [Clostridium ganghwense]|uniref:SprT family zinc-dependent metalloprotease n=1 Tax=Clostridium ganghwense TaxID=312089 RepID=A0ABT4CTF3_9CLOT|nr:SprT family zinc-dependent metalloprotease [Clostridium ganghwense]MCY6371234.1 SprT family zinc-dependent metalloprotease [Clostridium ganghwense]